VAEALPVAAARRHDVRPGPGAGATRRVRPRRRRLRRGRATHAESPLASRARAEAAQVRTFADADALPEDDPNLERRLELLRAKLEAWGALVQRTAGTPRQALVLVEEERLEEQAARLVVAYRHVLADGDGAAERSLLFLIRKHAESKRLPTHVLALGDLYADQLRDYVEKHDRPLEFEMTEFTRHSDRALDAYQKVADWDGVPKAEATGRFAALEAYRDAILERYR
jgi:hypothetical protein